MTYATQVIALSREEVQRFRSPDPYVVISLTDTDAEHPRIASEQAFKDRLSLQFDDVYPEHTIGYAGVAYCAMRERDAEQIAGFVLRWWGKVATIVVHCHAGLSRSTGVAAAIRAHHGQDGSDLFEAPRNPNRHCLDLVSRALVRAGGMER